MQLATRLGSRWRASLGGVGGTRWRRQYGPWAVVAGGSQGLGAAYARALARCGLQLVLVAEASEPLGQVAAELRDACGVQVIEVVADLALPGSVDQVLESASGLEVGLLVCNAAHAPVGPFLRRSRADALRAIAVNCLAHTGLIHGLAPAMVRRKRGGVLLMSSLAGLQGTALVTSYAATKAFDLVLAEGLWEELRGSGVDVLAVLAGETRTEMYVATNPRQGGLRPGPMAPEAVVRQALAALGHGPRVVTGRMNRLSAGLLGRLPRRLALAVMGRSMRAMYPQHCD